MCTQYWIQLKTPEWNVCYMYKIQIRLFRPVLTFSVSFCAVLLPILWDWRCLSISPNVGLVPRQRMTVIRSLASIFPFCFLSCKEKHSLNSGKRDQGNVLNFIIVVYFIILLSESTFNIVYPSNKSRLTYITLALL